MAKISESNRGKKEEDAVKAVLKELSEQYATFDYARLHDTHSARNPLPPQPADFEFFFNGRHGLLEVKCVAHDYLLPKANLSVEQIGRMRKRMLAGGTAHVIIYHSTSKLWRAVPVEFFFTRLGQASWDVSEYPQGIGCKVSVMDAVGSEYPAISV